MLEHSKIASVERMHMTEKRRNIYIAGEDYNFVWDYRDVQEFIRLWGEGADIRFIAKHFKRPQPEIIFLLVDLAEKRKIKQRQNGLFGGYQT
jgi:hypothetical protein